MEHAGAVNLSTSPRVGYTYSDGTAGHVRRTRMVYPNGRVLRYEYRPGADEQLNRVSFLADDASGTVGTHLVEYQRLGLNTFVQTDYPQPGLRCDLAHGSGSDPYVGLDPFDRIVDLRWWNPTTGVDVERVQHGYDRAGNRLWRQCPVAESYGKHFDELYRYDGVDQLVSLDRGDLNADKSALVSGTKTFAEAWTLDATGNWLRYRQDTDGDGIWNLDQSRDHNAANEILAIAASSAHVAHDRAGNMTRIPSPLTGEGQGEGASHHTLTYDAWNRLVRVADGATGQTLAEYDYDGRSFRTVKRSYAAGALAETRHSFYTADWQVLEERLGTSPTADRQFVWGLRYIDDLVLRDRFTPESTERLYALQDPNWNVTCLSDSEVLGAERCCYLAYGRALILSPTLDARNSSLYGWCDWFAGRCVDSVTGLYYYRRRECNNSIGRLAQRDPYGYEAGSNLYAYADNSPTGATDPMGLKTFKVRINFYFQTLRLTPGIKAEVDRIFQSCFKSQGCTDTVSIQWIAASSAAGLDRIPLGYSEAGWFNRHPGGVDFHVDDGFKLQDKPGQGWNFHAKLNAAAIKDAASEVHKGLDLAIAATMAHELGLYGLQSLWPSHYHDYGYVDADMGGQIGGEFSPEACKSIVKSFGLCCR
jgi:RHS repeat-associated protein